jgi:hypothetical protein
MMELDLSPYSTQSRMWIEHHTKRQDAICAEITALRHYVDALAATAAMKANRYESSRLFRALRALRLL